MPIAQRLALANKIVPEEKDKPIFDERPLAQLLEAAFVLQEHNRNLQKLEVSLASQKQHLAAEEPPVASPPPKPATHPVESLQAAPVALPVESVVPEAIHSNPAATEPVETLTAIPAPSPVLVEPSIPLRILEDPVRPEPVPAEPILIEHAPLEPVLAEPFLTEPAPLLLTEPAPLPAAVPVTKGNYSLTLAQIVETQDQIRVRHLALEKAMSLVAERVTEIAKAGGAAICFLDGKIARYQGIAGLMAPPVGTEIPVEKALCEASLRAGQVIRCSDLNTEFLLDVEECRRRGIQAMIAVPIYHDGHIAGGMELYYAVTQAFTEQDVHTCQLMAGLITEALARQEEVAWKKSVASERAVMLQALEKLKPNLAALMDTPVAKDSASRTVGQPTGAATATAVVCQKCGHKLLGEEQFCGKCGSARGASYEPPTMQSKVASLWHMQEALKKNANESPVNGDVTHDATSTMAEALGAEKPLADSIEEEMPEFFAAPELRISKMPPPPVFVSPDELVLGPIGGPIGHAAAHPPVMPFESTHYDDAEQEEEDRDQEEPEPAPTTAIAKSAPAANWASASTARQFLEQLAGAKQPGGLTRFWNARRGDIYLAVAVILVAAVIRWGIWSNHSVSATGTPPTVSAGHRKAAPDADLSVFDRMLIGLGLAEAPPAPEYKGNPNAQVWVDLHTALYYCAEADLYGKTPKGKFTTQRDAQLDQFEPAYRKTCD